MGGPRRGQYSVDNLEHLIAVIDPSDRAVGPLFDGVILTEFQAVSGRYFMPWTNGEPSHGSDWEQYLDSLSSAAGPLSRLDSAAGLLNRATGAGHKISIVVMVPYPDVKSGAQSFRGRSFDLSRDSDRVAVVTAYLHEVVQRVQSQRLSNLSFYGFYWLNEGITPTDSIVVSRVIAAAHAVELHFLWIPSYGAAGAESWRSFGFDQAWLQPNYFFHPDQVPRARLDTAVAKARAAKMGLEIEFDSRLVSDERFSNRLEPYLTTLENAPDLRDRSIAVYEGGGALFRLARSSVDWQRALYNKLVTLLTSASHS